MTSEAIDHQTLAALVERGSVRAANVVAQAGGCGVVVRQGRQDQPLSATRSGKLRLFKPLETVAAYLHDIGLRRFDVDATGLDLAAGSAVQRPDRSDVLKRVHQAAAHDAWFRRQVEATITEADDKNADWEADGALQAAWADEQAAPALRAAGGT